MRCDRLRVLILALTPRKPPIGRGGVGAVAMNIACIHYGQLFVSSDSDVVKRRARLA
jgi:hypothetical protein